MGYFFTFCLFWEDNDPLVHINTRESLLGDGCARPVRVSTNSLGVTPAESYFSSG